LAGKKKYKLKKAPEEEKEDSTSSRFIGKFGQSPRKERTPEERKEYKKLALYLVGWTILLTAIYMTCVTLEFRPVMPIYTIAGGVFFIVWLIFNGGFKKPDYTQYEKPDEMGYDEYCTLLDKLKERQRKAKYFMVLFLPFFLIMLVDYVIIFWGDKLAG
jgi:predicted nucleic acid-binding Zn ribbon protein